MNSETPDEMSLPFNPALAELPTYQPGRPIDEVAREWGLAPEEIIKLASNENPLGPSPAAVDAMRGTLEHLHLYPDGNAYHLKQKLAEHLGLAPHNLILGNGSNEIIEFVGHALLQPGTDAVMSQFCFAIYPIVTLMFGARPVVVPAREFGHDLARMRQAVTDRTRILFVANPNNPTGTRTPNKELRNLVRNIPGHVLLVLDEAYIEFLDDPEDFLEDIRKEETPNLLLMRTFSKIHGLAGLRVGYGIGPAPIVSALEKVRQPFNLNTMAQTAALAALDDKAHVERTRETTREGLRFFEEELKKMNLEYIPSSANFITVRVGNANEVFRELQKRGVITRPLGGYQMNEWLRISIGTPRENQHCMKTLQSISPLPAA